MIDYYYTTGRCIGCGDKQAEEGSGYDFITKRKFYWGSIKCSTAVEITLRLFKFLIKFHRIEHVFN